MKRSKGFSLIELMVSVIVLAILATLAAPGLREFLVNSGVKKAASDLHFGLLFARSEAVNRGVPVTIKPSDNADWKSGWVVVVGATELRVGDRLPDDLNSITSPLSVVFNPDGRSTTSATFKIQRSDKSSATRCVGVRATGMPFNKENIKQGDCTDA